MTDLLQKNTRKFGIKINISGNTKIARQYGAKDNEKYNYNQLRIHKALGIFANMVTRRTMVIAIMEQAPISGVQKLMNTKHS